MFDSHSHLDAPEFDADRPQVLERARAAGIHSQLVPAIARRNWEAVAQLCCQYEGLLPAYGLHPLYQSEHRIEDLLALRVWLKTHPAAALGEIGLDFYPGVGWPNEQVEYFHAQLAIAREFDLPVVLHARRAVDPVLQALKKYGVKRGVLHSFSGSLQQAQALIKQGLLLGLGGPLTYPRANRLRHIAAQLPIEHLLVETDSPDQPLCGFQGQRNEPARLQRVISTLAELRGSTPTEIEHCTDANAIALFSSASAATCAPL